MSKIFTWGGMFIVLALLGAGCNLQPPTPGPGLSGGNGQNPSGQLAPADWKTYRNPLEGYEISYPADFRLAEGVALTQLIHNQGTVTGTQIAFSELYIKGTNLNQAWVMVGVVKTTQANCSKMMANYSNQGQATIGYINFTTYKTQEGAAGHAYDTINYQTYTNERCINVLLTTDSSPVENWEPPRPREFDRGQVEGIFRDILKTFKIM